MKRAKGKRKISLGSNGEKEGKNVDASASALLPVPGQEGDASGVWRGDVWPVFCSLVLRFYI